MFIILNNHFSINIHANKVYIKIKFLYLVGTIFCFLCFYSFLLLINYYLLRDAEIMRQKQEKKKADAEAAAAGGGK